MNQVILTPKLDSLSSMPNLWLTKASAVQTSAGIALISVEGKQTSGLPVRELNQVIESGFKSLIVCQHRSNRQTKN